MQYVVRMLSFLIGFLILALARAHADGTENRHIEGEDIVYYETARADSEQKALYNAERMAVHRAAVECGGFASTVTKVLTHRVSESRGTFHSEVHVGISISDCDRMKKLPKTERKKYENPELAQVLDKTYEQVNAPKQRRDPALQDSLNNLDYKLEQINTQLNAARIEQIPQDFVLYQSAYVSHKPPSTDEVCNAQFTALMTKAMALITPDSNPGDQLAEGIPSKFFKAAQALPCANMPPK